MTNSNRKTLFILLAVFVAGCAWQQPQMTDHAEDDICKNTNVICAYQGKGYESSELGLTLSPKDIASGTGTLNMKLPGHPFKQDVSVKVGDSWMFDANGMTYRLTILSIGMSKDFFDPRGGFIHFEQLKGPGSK